MLLNWVKQTYTLLLRSVVRCNAWLRSATYAVVPDCKIGIPYACFTEFSNDNRHLLVGTWKNGYVLENNLQ